MIQAFHDHAVHRDDFEMIAIHDSSVESLEEMDEKIKSAKKNYWKGEDLPFTVLIDNDKQTEKTFGISGHPTQIIIDPDGLVVGESSLAAFEKELPPLPASVLWARHRDLQKNSQWSWDGNVKLKQILKLLNTYSQLECEINSKLSKEYGLTEDSELAVFVNGYGITLRSLEQLIFEPYSAELAPADDGESLVLRKRSSQSDEPTSHFQKLHNQQLLNRIASKNRSKSSELSSKAVPDQENAGEDQSETETQPGEQPDSGEEPKQPRTPPLELKEIGFRDAVKRIATHFNLSMGINAEALKQANQKVSGTIDGSKLEVTLNQLFNPLGLMVVVRFEMVLVVPIEE